MLDLATHATIVARAAAAWRDRNSQQRVEARHALAQTRWSAQVCEAALDDVLADADAETIAAQITFDRVADERPVVVILPGNIIGPTIASAFCAAAAGASVILKSSGEERALAPIVARQFDLAGPPLTGTILATYWKGGDETDLEAAAIAAARRVIVFGSDETCTAVRRQARNVPVVAFGDAYSLGFVAAGADLRDAATAAARDICMFDQRGCLSPQTIYVEGDEGRAILFAQALARALERLSVDLPRARPEDGEAANAAAWMRQFSAIAIPPVTHGLDTLSVGTMRDGCPDHMVAAVPAGPPIRAGFGRIVAVMPLAAAASTFERVGRCDSAGRFGPPSAAIDAAIRAASPKRICQLGQMQRPPFGYRPSVSDFA
jgi:acyl-CoA reductase-like NAD-dependent aldehyde dehydrogenase